MATNTWPSEWQRGLLPTAILGILGRHPLHGYGIIRELEKHNWGAIPGGALYPILRVLETRGLVTGSWRIAERGLARKYYRPIQAGLGLLFRQRTRWDTLPRSMTRILGREADRGE